MVSFRNSQLRAIVLALVIADALSHGQLPWRRGGTPAATPRPPSAGAIADDRWCQAIGAQLQAVATASQPWLTVVTEPLLTTAPVAQSAADAPTLTPLLMRLPQVLCQLDDPPSATADAATTALQASLTACLRQDERSLMALQQRWLAGAAGLSPTIHTGLTQAIAAVLAAHGDFQLAIGQSCYESPAIVGLPVLTGILSAGWGDLSSIPGRYRHWLRQPDPKLRHWLQQRWQIADESTLTAWATAVWQRWLGMEHVATRRLPVAVMPLATAAPPES